MPNNTEILEAAIVFEKGHSSDYGSFEYVSDREEPLFEDELMDFSGHYTVIRIINVETDEQYDAWVRCVEGRDPECFAYDEIK